MKVRRGNPMIFDKSCGWPFLWSRDDEIIDVFHKTGITSTFIAPLEPVRIGGLFDISIGGNIYGYFSTLHSGSWWICVGSFWACVKRHVSKGMCQKAWVKTTLKWECVISIYNNGYSSLFVYCLRKTGLPSHVIHSSDEPFPSPVF